MKKIFLSRMWLCLIAVFFMLQMYSCKYDQSFIDFRLTKSDTIKTLSPIENVKSFSLRYNPKGNGVINIALMNGSEYTAEKLNPSQISFLLDLLKSEGVQFDTTNEEFLLKGGNNE